MPEYVSNEDVEIAARAIHEYDMRDPWDDDGCNDTGGGAHTSCKEQYLGRARAALEAVAPPTSEEIDAALAAAYEKIRETSTIARYRLVPIDLPAAGSVGAGEDGTVTP